MPVRAVTTRFMYKGLCTIPDVLSYRTPVNLPEDEVEGESLLADCLVGCLCWLGRGLNLDYKELLHLDVASGW